MRVAMFTNVYTPKVGGVTRSVQLFADRLRGRGHDVLVVAPDFDHAPHDEEGVLRVPAIRHVGGTPYSAPFPFWPTIAERMRLFQPDVMHAHHPFLLGSAAVRQAYRWEVPLVYTHHTRYELYVRHEDYGGLLPLGDTVLEPLTQELTAGFCNLCDGIVAPGSDMKVALETAGVTTPIEVIPTGVDRSKFVGGNGARCRERVGIPADAPVVGHVGRLAPEKNLKVLIDAMLPLMQQQPDVHFLVVGEGPMKQDLLDRFRGKPEGNRLHAVGFLQGEELIDAYHAMDVFGFSSQSETQGMVLVEAMAAGVPVVALDASGVRDVVRTNENGVLVDDGGAPRLRAAIEAYIRQPPQQRQQAIQGALATAERFSLEACTERLERLYEGARERWDQVERVYPVLVKRIEAEWLLWTNAMHALATAVVGSASTE